MIVIVKMEDDRMDVVFVEDYEAMSRRAAEIVAGQIRQKPDSVLGLATGSTPLGLYHLLCRWFYYQHLPALPWKSFFQSTCPGCSFCLAPYFSPLRVVMSAITRLAAACISPRDLIPLRVVMSTIHIYPF